MKMFKQMISCMLVLVMVFSLGMSALATADTGSSESSSVSMQDGSNNDFASDADNEVQPLASHSKAIIVIPGIAGTELEIKSGVEAGVTAWFIIGNTGLTACTENGTSVYDIEPVASGLSKYGILNKYKYLCEQLQNNFGSNYDVVFFPYDWRMRNTDSASKLATMINNAGYSEVILVAYSMGGLVASSYLKTSSNRNKVDKLITIGTPYLGSPKGVYVMETGSLVDGWTGVVANLGIKAVANNFPATYQLFPVNRSFTNYIKKGTTTLSGYTVTTNFLKTLPWAKKSSGAVKSMYTNAETYHSGLLSGSTHYTDLSTVETYRIVGNSQDTITTVLYDSNGKYSDIIRTNAGDGTVTEVSARNNTYNKPVYVTPSEHLALVSNGPAVARVVAIINGQITRSASSQDIEKNDRGWIMGLDNKRISIQISGNDEATFTTADGQTLIEENAAMYLLDDTGERNQVGTVWLLGNGIKDYYLHDGDYDVTISTVTSGVKVEYSDSGYYDRVLTFDDFEQGSVILHVGNYANRDVICEYQAIDSRANGVILPANELSADELADYKDPNG